ncbi:AhpD-like protein [Apiosordaria backusii]|uniref:AhpD-like protein n=1 Tax=Apiosordaria backusii TaxID=314023 RepID=A0AA40BSX2_9PEZI|nr:AhpD-like protein [Apiosordaria backusii]
MSSFPSIITPALLSSIRSRANLPVNTWYFIAATTLSQLNRPDEIQKVYLHALGQRPLGAEVAEDGPPAVPSLDEKRDISRRMREALIKAAPVTGVPKTINALLELKNVTPDDLLDEPQGPSPTGRPTDVYNTPITQILKRGQDFFEGIYGKITKRVMGQMDRSGTEDLGLIARLVYGYILSNTNVLSAVETSYVMIAGLIPQDVNPQLKGHLRGALNGGATVEEVKAVRSIVMEICIASGMKMLDDQVPAGFGWRVESADL